MALRILLVEDSEDDTDLLRFTLEDAGLDFELHRTSSEQGVQRALLEFEPDIVVSDLNLPGYSGWEALALLHSRAPELPLVLLTGDEDVQRPPRLPVAVLDKSAIDRLPEILSALTRR